MKTKLRILTVALMAGGAMFAQPRISVGIAGYGADDCPPPARAPYRVTQRFVETRYDNVNRDRDRDDRDRRDDHRSQARGERFDNHGDERFDSRGANSFRR